MQNKNLPSIIEKVVDTAARNLHSCGCKYVILLPNGHVLAEGGLELKTRQRRRSTEPRESYVQSGYIDAIKALKVGETYAFDAVAFGFQVKKFAKAVSGSASANYGPGNHAIQVEGNRIVLMRLG